MLHDWDCPPPSDRGLIHRALGLERLERHYVSLDYLYERQVDRARESPDTGRRVTPTPGAALCPCDLLRSRVSVCVCARASSGPCPFPGCSTHDPARTADTDQILGRHDSAGLTGAQASNGPSGMEATNDSWRGIRVSQIPR